jgi:hypothetical protein
MPLVISIDRESESFSAPGIQYDRFVDRRGTKRLLQRLTVNLVSFRWHFEVALAFAVDVSGFT